MQKDYMNLAKRNFRAMAFIAFFPSALFLANAFTITGGLSALESRMAFLRIGIFYLVTFVVLLIIASLFKKKSPKAIVLAYTYIGFAFILSLVNYFIINSPSDFFKGGIGFKVLGYIVLIYLLNSVYKASKQKPQLIQGI
ncbi:hypothetical protein COB55_01950 [Candidatus Wolfebacteria bacterium]|nr:MAG: hypothetical protein COB55_01950 [Candidatus Wolfebacteria bacterium]